MTKEKAGMASMREKGDIIVVNGGREYRILACVGNGGFSDVYRAEQIGEESAVVLLKEYHRTAPDGFSSMEEYIQLEKENNDLVRDSRFNGALTISSFVEEKETGRIFGVMRDLRIGWTLYEYVSDSQWERSSLSQKVLLGKRIFDILDEFHKKCNMVHGDIRPDNIFLYETGTAAGSSDSVMPVLLDFGLSHLVESSYLDGDDRSDADRLPGEMRRIFPEADFDDELYEPDWKGAVDCFWFLLTGREAVEYSISEGHLWEAVRDMVLSYTHNSFTGNDIEQRFMAERRQQEKYMLKKLYQDIFDTNDYSSGLCGRMNEIYEMTLQTGIHRDQLYRYLLQDYNTLREDRFAELDILRKILPGVGFEAKRHNTRVSFEGTSEYVQLHELVGASGKSYFMIGDGGIGKTTSLIDVLDRAYKKGEVRGDLENKLVVFLELCVLSQDSEQWYDEKNGGTFIEQFIAAYYMKQPRTFLEKDHPFVQAIHDELFRKADGPRDFIILLDGLNEVGFLDANSRHRFYETMNRYLQYGHNMQLIITGRSDAFELSREYLSRLETQGLDDAGIEEMLLDAVGHGCMERMEYERLRKNRDNISSMEYRLWSCLRIPFFIQMYCSISKRLGLTRQGEILKEFFHDKRETLDGSVQYGERIEAERRYGNRGYGGGNRVSMALSVRIILDLVIPEIALSMVVNGLYYITDDALRAFLLQELPELQKNKGKKWPRWYYGYELDVAEIIGEIWEIDKGARIAEYACEVLGIMRKTTDNALFFTHQYFRDYFAARAVINHMLNLQEVSQGRLAHQVPYGELRALLYPLHERELSGYVCSLVGEILGEHHNMPQFNYKTGQWEQPDPSKTEQKLVENILGLYRDRGGRDKGASMAVRNLIEILKLSRIQNIGMADLTGVAFDGLDLTGVSLHDVILSRQGRNGNLLTASFYGTSGAVNALLLNEKTDAVVCCGIHPDENLVLMYDQTRGELTEQNLDNGESRVIAVNLFDLKWVEYRRKPYDIVIMTSNMVPVEKKKAPEPVRRKSYGVVGRFLKAMELEEDWDEGWEDEDDFEEYEDFDDATGEDSYKEVDVVSNRSAGEMEEHFNMYYYDRATRHMYSSAEITQELLYVGYDDTTGLLELVLREREDGQIILWRMPADKLMTIMGDIRRNMIGLDLPSADFFKNIEDKEFIIRRVDKNHFLLGSSVGTPFSLGLWDTENNEVSTVLRIDKVDNQKFRCRAITQGARSDEFLYLPEDGDGVGLYKIDHRNRTEYEYFQTHELQDLNLAGNDGIYRCKRQNRRLVFDRRKLYLFDIESMDIIWSLGRPVNDIQFHNDILIANASDGIWRIDLSTGNMTCIRNKGEAEPVNILGMTDRRDTVILYDNRQTVKWIDTGSGIVQKISILQKNDRVCSDVYASNDAGYIYGISRDSILYWDAFSGAFIGSAAIELPEDAAFKYMKFAGAESAVLVYYDRVDYSVFPPQKAAKADLRSTHVNEHGKTVLHRETIAEDSSAVKVRLTPKLVIAEHPTSREPVREIPEREEKVTARTEFARMRDEVFRTEPDPRTFWSLEEPFQEYKYKTIQVLDAEDGKEIIEESIGTSEYVVGMIGKLLFYSDSQYRDGSRMILANKSHRENVTIEELWNRTVTNALALGNRAVFLTSPAGGEPSDQELVFWRSDNEQVYLYPVSEGILGTGCASLDYQDTDERNLLIYEGMSKERNTRIVVNQAKRAFEKKREVLRKMPERMLSVNFVAVLLCAMLFLTGYYGRAVYDLDASSTTASASAVAGGILSRIVGVSLLYIIICLAVTLAMNSFLPFLLDRLPGRRVVLYLVALLSLVFGYYASGLFTNHFMIYRYSTFYEILALAAYALYVSLLAKEPCHDMVSVMDLFSLCLIFYALYDISYVSEIMLAEFFLLAIVTYSIVIYTSEISASLRKTRVGLFGGFASAVSIFVYSYFRSFSLQTDSFFGEYVQLMEKNRSIISGAKLLGNAGNWTSEVLSDYQEYYLVYFADRFGLLAMLMILLLLIWLLIFLFLGAKKQAVKIDRYLCFGCAGYLALRSVVYVLTNLGIVSLPPGKMPLCGIWPFANAGAIAAFMIYNASYHAHKMRKWVHDGK